MPRTVARSGIAVIRPKRIEASSGRLAVKLPSADSTWTKRAPASESEQQLRAQVEGTLFDAEEEGKVYLQYDVDEGEKVYYELDPDVEKALEALPKAQQLLESPSRMVAEQLRAARAER